jgi:hypothetical protein
MSELAGVIAGTDIFEVEIELGAELGGRPRAASPRHVEQLAEIAEIVLDLLRTKVVSSSTVIVICADRSAP